MSRQFRFAIAFTLSAAVFLTASCASTPGDEAKAAEARPARPARRSNVLITQQELRESSSRDAYQAVQMLRPDWLRGRGSTTLLGTPPEVVVYLDGQRLGNKNTLSQLPTQGIKELRFFGATDATQRWGTGHGAGVIEVVTR